LDVNEESVGLFPSDQTVEQEKTQQAHHYAEIDE
jgi:hypothetical protein